MKNSKHYITAAVVLLSTVGNGGGYTAALFRLSTVGVSASQGGATNNIAIISAPLGNNGAPVVTYLNATSDKAGSFVTFYKCSPPILVTGANTTVSIPCTTNGGAMVVAARTS